MSASAARPRVELANSIHQLPHGSTALRRTNPSHWIELTVGVRRTQNLPDLANLDYLMPKERKYLSRDQLAKEYGSDPAAIEAIKKFAKAHSLLVTRNEPASARLGLAGTTKDLSGAFGVTLFDYKHPDLGQFHARTGPVEVPPELANAITGVFGFNNHRIMRRRLQSAQSTPDLAVKSRSWFVPADLARIYNFPDANAADQCIGLLEFGGGVDQSDVTAYFKKIGTPAPDVRIVAADGVSTDPAADPDSTGEVMLDIDVVGALAGGAKVAVYFSTFDEKGLIDCLSSVINDSANDPSVLSVSWGWDENQPFNQGILWSPAAIDHVNHSLLAIAQLGITVCVSTGDDGSEAQVKDGRAHVNFPATSPYVLAVGGTTLHARNDLGGAQAITEVVWNDGPGSGTGGGVSDITPVPDWQKGIVPASINPHHFAGRAIPDVAANADPATGYLVMSGGKLQIVGGTSASAPLWASLITRINALTKARTGNFNALLYGMIGPANVLRDIVSGNNDTDGLLQGQFQAGSGWDACTGWGTPDGTKLLAALTAPAKTSAASLPERET
jgi:kumamolisin